MTLLHIPFEREVETLNSVWSTPTSVAKELYSRLGLDCFHHKNVTRTQCSALLTNILQHYSTIGRNSYTIVIVALLIV